MVSGLDVAQAGRLLAMLLFEIFEGKLDIRALLASVPDHEANEAEADNREDAEDGCHAEGDCQATQSVGGRCRSLTSGQRIAR